MLKIFFRLFIKEIGSLIFLDIKEMMREIRGTVANLKFPYGCFCSSSVIFWKTNVKQELCLSD